MWGSVLALPTCLVAASVSVEATCKFPWDNFLPCGVQCDRLVAHSLELPTPLAWCWNSEDCLLCH